MITANDILKLTNVDEVSGANEGHALERLIAICKGYKILPDYIELLNAVKKFVFNNHKPNWADDLIYDVSGTIISILQDRDLGDKEWSDVAWGLDLDALKDAGLLKHRK